MEIARSTWRRILARLAAEFGVVVLGVTIALWADGWVAEREDRAVEAARVTALADNVRETIALLRPARREAQEASDALTELAVLRHATERPIEELKELLLTGLFYVPIFTPELNVYDDLKSSGELALLTDPDMRRALSAMDNELEAVRVAQNDLSTVQQLNYDSYLIGRVDLRELLVPYLELPVDAAPGGFDPSFVEDLEFRNLVLFKLDLARQMESVFHDAQEALRTVQALMEEQVTR